MGKDKSIKPPRHVALAIVFSPSTHRILMITSRKHPHLWILPKGGIEDGETSGQAAVREAWEEAGSPKDLVAPTDDERLMMIALEATKQTKRSAVWHIHVVRAEESEIGEEWPESDQRKRQWYTLHECQSRIQEWYNDPKLADEVDGESAVVDKNGKKGQKGGAMETALKVFADKYGWTKAD